jgi:hypothetical protein
MWDLEPTKILVEFHVGKPDLIVDALKGSQLRNKNMIYG